MNGNDYGPKCPLRFAPIPGQMMQSWAAHCRLNEGQLLADSVENVGHDFHGKKVRD